MTMKPNPKIDPEFEAFKAGLQIQNDELFIWGQFFHETEEKALEAFNRFKVKTLKDKIHKDKIWNTDISKAPKDGTEILGAIGDFTYVLFYQHSKKDELIGNFKVWKSNDASYKNEDIFAWMLIPSVDL